MKNRQRKLKQRWSECRRLMAFTLAEVLITLGIIGVVAAMTIPTLIQAQQDKATVTAVKKSFSIISEAYKRAAIDNGSPEEWDLIGLDSGVGAVNMVSKLEPYLKIVKNCGMSTGCWPDTVYWRNGDSLDLNDGKRSTVIIADGSSMVFSISDKDCKTSIGSSLILNNVCGNIFVDINGFKKPNVVGKDEFRFWISKYGIAPTGTPDTTQYTFNDDCRATTQRGRACTAWVIYNENLDYLHCSDLAWGTKTKCD